ncbi:solute carrier family 35 member C2 isoform X2 [Agrilus planipennis]|uniref:Solute carrier family 35 member C2 isoform X2 n=1 Tax=Agrilus planipennis TaxID=224129 RepID=A0A1W4XIG8_AGRPL|nr:solute carrier family 35 member C2 isoform X2 [Agrilus planipennis]
MAVSAFVRIILTCGGRPRAHVSWRDHIVAVAPTGLFSGIDIGFSNWGLELVTVSLYTMTKSTVIIFILLFAILFKLEKKSWSLCFIVVMISTGLLLFTYKATHFNIVGFVLVLLASMSSGVRWTCVQLLLQKSHIKMSNPIDMIYHMQPWMALSIFPFVVWIEGLSLISSCQVFRISDREVLISVTSKVLLGAFIAFLMELSEVMVVMYTSSLTLSVAGIFKEIFMLIAAVKWNGDVLSPINILGLVVCLSGIISHVIHKIKMIRYHNPNRVYKMGLERYELNESLVNNIERFSLTSDSDSEQGGSDSNVIFNVLHRRER